MAVPDISPTTHDFRRLCSRLPNDHQTTFEDLVTSSHDQLLFLITPDCFEQFKIVGNTLTEFTDLDLSRPYQTRPATALSQPPTDHLGRDRSASISAKCDPSVRQFHNKEMTDSPAYHHCEAVSLAPTNTERVLQN